MLNWISICIFCLNKSDLNSRGLLSVRVKKLHGWGGHSFHLVHVTILMNAEAHARDRALHLI